MTAVHVILWGLVLTNVYFILLAVRLLRQIKALRRLNMHLTLRASVLAEEFAVATGGTEGLQTIYARMFGPAMAKAMAEQYPKGHGIVVVDLTEDADGVHVVREFEIPDSFD